MRVGEEGREGKKGEEDGNWRCRALYHVERGNEPSRGTGGAPSGASERREMRTTMGREMTGGWKRESEQGGQWKMGGWMEMGWDGGVMGDLGHYGLHREVRTDCRHHCRHQAPKSRRWWTSERQRPEQEKGLMGGEIEA